MGFNGTLASYLALALSPHLASHRLKDDNQRRKELELDYRRLMKNRTMQEVFDKTILKYYFINILIQEYSCYLIFF